MSPFKRISLQNYHTKRDEEGQEIERFPACFNMCGDPTKCPYGFSLLIDPTKGCPH